MAIQAPDAVRLPLTCFSKMETSSSWSRSAAASSYLGCRRRYAAMVSIRSSGRGSVGSGMKTERALESSFRDLMGYCQRRTRPSRGQRDSRLGKGNAGKVCISSEAYVWEAILRSVASSGEVAEATCQLGKSRDASGGYRRDGWDGELSARAAWW